MFSPRVNQPPTAQQRPCSSRSSDKPRDEVRQTRRVSRFQSAPMSERTRFAVPKVVLCAVVLLASSSGLASANSDCACVPEVVLPGGNLARLRDVATTGKASRVAVSVTVRLKAIDVTPGSCSTGESSDPVLATIFLEDDDGDVILNRSKAGFVCTAGKKTHAKFTTYFEGPKNCKNSSVPAGKSKGNITGWATTDDGALSIARKIFCAEAVPVAFSFDPPPNYHVTVGDTLNFSVTASRRDEPLTVTASGLPASANFDGSNFSWLGAFSDLDDSGNHNVTFTADGESTVVNIATTQYPVTGANLVGLDGAPVFLLSVPLGGQALVSVQPQYDNPLGVPSLGGQGANSWNQFDWSVDATYVADFFSTTNVAVVEGVGDGTTQLRARFTDAALGEVATAATLNVLEVVSVAVSPPALSMPTNSTEPLVATATLEGGAQTTRIPFSWSTSDAAVATVLGGFVLGTANVTTHNTGMATITASTSTGPVVSGTIQAEAVAPLRDQELFGLNQKPTGNQIVSIDTAGNAPFLAAMLAPYDDEFCASSSHDSNEMLVGSIQSSTGFSQIQRIDSAGNVTPVFTSTTVTPFGDTIDPQAIRYRPDGEAYFAMSEGQHTLTRVNQSGQLTVIGGPTGNDGDGPIAIAPFGNNLVYSGPWGMTLLGSGNKIEGFAELVGRYVPGSNTFVARVGVSQPRLVAPDGELWILDGESGELFRFEDLDADGNYYDIVTENSAGQIIQYAVDDPGERIAAGQLPVGFNRLHLDAVTGDIIATRVVGTVPQRITVMRVADLNSDGDVDDAGEQAVVFDAGAPAGTDTVDVLLKY